MAKPQPQPAKPKSSELELREERERSAVRARNAVIAEFGGSADRLAQEIMRLRLVMGQASQALTLALDG